MKIRNGFVSNSSSSSFIVAFDKNNIPTTIDAVKKLLFDGKDLFENIFHYGDGPEAYLTSEMAQIVLGDMKSPITDEKNILDEIQSGSFDGQPEYPYVARNETDKERNKRWNNHQRDCEKAAKKLYDKFVKDNKDKVLYKFHYSDGNGNMGSIMEHGDIFKNLPHIHISQH